MNPHRMSIRKAFGMACTSTAAMLLVALAGCASLNPNYEQPTVTLSSFRALPSEGMTPGFEIGLRIINPNPGSLALSGVVYTVSIQGHELVKGVGKDFPEIEGYSQGDITLTASANLLGGIRLLGDLMQVGGDTLEYDFEARLDLAGLHPSIRVHEKGAIELAPQSR